MLGLNTKINKSFINSHLQEAHPTLPVHLMEREYQDSQSVLATLKKKKKKLSTGFITTHICVAAGSLILNWSLELTNRCKEESQLV